MTNDEKIAHLWEVDRITKVMLQFGRALDLGDWAAYRECMTNPVTIEFTRLTGQPRARANPADFAGFAEAILSPVKRHHSFSNFHIELDGDRATAMIHMTARHWKATDLGSSSNAQHGWYDVIFAKEADNWLISEIKHDFQWIEGNGGLFDMTDPKLHEAMARVFNPTTFEAAATD